MIAGLLYIVGLAAIVVTIIMVGYAAPALVQAFMAAIEVPNPDYLGAVATFGQALGWALGPFVGGLVLMGFGRVIALLGAINRALRGNP